MSEKNLDVNINFIKENKNKFLFEYPNKYLLISDGKIINSFDTYEKAAEEGVRLFGLEDNFLVYFMTENEPINFVMEALL
ncbi:hypothetical protein HZB07_01525 [Candidatus Saganbacteria bacterium]|nr:hypothetical protein [Candidatus Saganbacteria bacterium]